MLIAVASLFTSCESSDSKLVKNLKGSWEGTTLVFGEETPVQYQFFESTDGKTGKFVEGGIKEQTEQSLKNIGEILKAAGCGYENVVKTTVLLSDMNNFKDMNEVYAKFFTSDCPARAAFQVVKLPLGAMVEIECVAVK